MTTEIRFHRAATVLLTAALLATLTVALTGGQRADAVDGPVEVAYVATGQNFPDALAGANLAATVGAPMLTVNPDLPIPDATTTALEALDPNQIIILGGPVAVSDAVEGALGDYARSGTVSRIEGGDRHETAAKIADALPSKVHDADQLDGLDSTDFARTADVPSAQTVSEHVSCTGRGFEPSGNNSGALQINSVSNTGRSLSNTAGSLVGLTCQVTLPDGAVVTGLDVAGIDSTASFRFEDIQLTRHELDGTPAGAVASAASVTTDAGTPGEFEQSGVVDASRAVVDNGQWMYALEIRMGPEVIIHGARVSYTVERVVG